MASLKPAVGVQVPAGDSDDADDDRAPFLSPGVPVASIPNGRRSRWAAVADGARAALRRLPRPRSMLARASTSAGLRGLCRGLALCVLLLVVGGVGSLALRQMISPEIDALLRERQGLRASLELLQTQLDNMTRVADSRLDTIHLLESELEKQAVQAAAATDALANDTGALQPAGRAAAGDLRNTGIASSLAYTTLLGSLLFLFVLYRIVRIMQGELRAHGKLAAGQLERGAPPERALSPPRSLRGILVDDDLAAAPASSSSAASRGQSGGAALSPKSGPSSKQSPQCYKRPQGDRLIV